MKYILILFITATANIFSQVEFTGSFESGNLSTVTTSDSVTYNVTTKEDIGGRWFYFKISDIKNRNIRVVFENTDVNRPMYSYDNVNYQRFTETESPSYNLFQKTFSEDSVYVAYYTPFNYSYLQQRLAKWEQSQFIKVDTLGFSPNNFPMQEIVLTDFSVPDESKYQVWIHARTHPGETPSSFHFDGIVQQLLENNEVMDYYRKNIVFYLIPFNNPEGVYYGRSRTNYFYVDQEREWDKEPDETAVEIQILKSRLKSICDVKPVDVFLNLHSQASSYCTFWIHTPGSTSDYFYRREYQFSNLNVSDNPYFVQSDFRESNLRGYFPEGWLWDTYGDAVMALTYETPYDQYSSGEWVTNENLYELGYRTVYAIGEYLELSHPKHMIVDNNSATVEGSWESSQFGLEFYGDDFIYNSNGNGSVTFDSGELEEGGLYDVFVWWAESNQNSFQTEFEITSDFSSKSIEKTQRTNGGQWNFIGDIEVQPGSNLQVKIHANSSGLSVADAVRFVYRSPITMVENEILPSGFRLYPNYPNPFNPSTTIRFDINESEHVILSVYNSLGEQVDLLVNKQLNAGTHEVVFNSTNYRNLSSGVYYYRLQIESYSETRGMMLVK